MHNLACGYERGEGVKQNMTEAIRWYTAAAEGGNADDMYNLGWLYDQMCIRDSSKSALGSYEADDFKDISHHALIQLAKVYEVTVDYLLGRSKTCLLYTSRCV